MTVLRGVLASAKGRTIVAASVILISGLAATFAARMLSERMIASDMQRRFSADAADISTAIGDRLRTHAEVLVSMQGLHASIGRVDRAQFRRYIDVLDLARRYPGFQALQSLRQVGPEGLDAFVAEMRADNSVDASGQPEFTVRPPGKRASYNVVEFVEPMRGNEDALGFDAGANPAQLDSLRRAAETGRIVATPPVKLVQDTSGGLGFILRAPIYRIGEPAQTTSQRVAALRGFVASVYRMNDLMRGVLDPRTLQQMQVQIVDRGYAKQTEGTLSGEPEDPSGAATLMYNSLEPNLNLVAQIAEAAGIAADRSLVVGERAWRVVFSARPGSIYEVDRLVPNLVLASGVVISLLMALLTVVGLRSRHLSGNLNALDAEQRALVDNPLRPAFAEGADQLATMLAEQVSLALANLDLREQLRSQAIRDQLTGLYNRRFLEDALTRETGRAARSDEPVAVAILDVDHFKRINDTYGHEAGDAVLRELGQVLLKTIRKTDIVGRFGGEEFLICCRAPPSKWRRRARSRCSKRFVPWKS